MNGGPSLTLSPGQPVSVWFPAVGQTKTDGWAEAQALGTKGHFSGQLTNRTEREGMKLK